VEEASLPDVMEYLHYINVGKSMRAVMASISLAGGGRAKPFTL
jgi:hypothetical protein